MNIYDISHPQSLPRRILNDSIAALLDLPKRRKRRALLGALLALSAIPLNAATDTWQGLGTDDNWTTLGNFTPASPSNGDDLHFAGSTRLTPNNNTGAGTAYTDIIFDAGAASFTLGGNAVFLIAGITNNSASSQTVSFLPIIAGTLGGLNLLSNQAFNAATGDLNLTSDVTLAGIVLTVSGSHNTSISGAINEFGGAGSLMKSGSGTLTLSGNNTFTGVTTITAGVLNVGSVNALNTNAAGGNITFAGGTLQFSAANQQDYSSRIKNSVAAISLDTNGQNVTFDAALDNSNGQGLTKRGLGTLTLTAINTYTGDTKVNGGTLLVSGGGQIASTGFVILGDLAADNGTLTITGATSQVAASGLVIVGNGGNGALQIQNGGMLTSFAGVVGNQFGSVGVATVDGVGSTWSMTSDLFIDNGGTGTLTISGGAVVSNGNGFIATLESYKGTVTVDGAGSMWNNSGDVTVGDFGPGTLNVTNGGVVTSVNGFIGNNKFGFTEGPPVVGIGTVTVDGAGSTWNNSGALSVGVSGTGTLSIQNGGVVNVGGGTGAVTLAQNAGSFGTLNIGNGGGAGTLNAASITGGAGTAIINFNHSDAAYTFAPQINGSIAVNQLGSGVTSLTGANTYTGGTTITGGFINFQNAGNFGAGNITLNGGGLQWAAGNTTDISSRLNAIGGGGATFDVGGNNVTLASVLSGSGGVTKQGAGTLTLTAANTYSGGTSIAGGALAISNDNNLGAASGALNFSNGGTLRTLASLTSARTGVLGAGGGAVDTNGFDSTLSGSFSGSGGLAKSGNGVLTLAAVNTYTGGTSINGGILAISNDNNLGAATGPLNLSNGGTLRTLASLTSARSGVLGAGGGAVDTNGFDSTLSGSFSGAGGLAKSGNGALTLTGASAYTGDTNVNAGTLFVDGSLASANVNVNPGGTLGGNGAFSGGVNNLGGLVSPGHSPGTITINGNFSQSSAGTLKIEIGGLSAGQFDLLKVGGSAKLGGTLQLVQLNGFQFAVGDSVTFLTAGGGVSGTFGTVVNPFSSGTMIGTQVVYGANSVSVQGVQNSFRRLVSAVAAQEAGLPTPAISANPTELPRLPAEISGQTRNQMAVAIALDESFLDPRNAKLIAHLDHENLDKVLGDLDRIAPDELTAIYQIAVAQSKVQTFNLQRRLDDVRSGSTGFSAAGLAMNGSSQGYSGPLGVAGQIEGAQGPDGKSDKKMVMTPSPDNRWGVFVTGNGEWANVGDTDNAAGYDLTSAGFTLGLDYKVTPNFVIGLGAGYARGSADLTEGGRITADGGKLSLYTSYFTGGFYADAAVQGGYNSYDTRRSAVEGTARGSTDGGELTALFGTGYQWKVGGLTFGPTGTFEYTYVGLGSFTEAGSLAPLHYPDQHQESIRSTFGAKATYDWKLGSMTLKPELRAGWQHDYGDTTFGMQSSFANGAGPEFLVHGPATGRDSLVVGAGVALQFTERVSTYIYYDGELARTNYQAHSVSGGFRFDF